MLPFNISYLVLPFLFFAVLSFSFNKVLNFSSPFVKISFLLSSVFAEETEERENHLFYKQKNKS